MAFISAGTPGIRTAQRPSCSNQAPGAVPWALGIFWPWTGTMACLRLLGVDPAVIERYNVVSGPVAAQMARGARAASGSDLAVAVTGLAGPGGGDAVRPVGTVYIAGAAGTSVFVEKFHYVRPDRENTRARAAHAALELALRLAQGKAPAGCYRIDAAACSDPAALAALDGALIL